MNTETYGDTVRRLRKSRGLTQPQLGGLARVSSRAIQDIEAGKTKRPHRDTVLAINSVLDIEGDATQERREWPDDVHTILDIVGAYLMTLTHKERLAWLREITPRIVGRG